MFVCFELSYFNSGSISNKTSKIIVATVSDSFSSVGYLITFFHNYGKKYGEVKVEVKVECKGGINVRESIRLKKFLKSC